MTDRAVHRLLALRERKGLFVPLVIWAVVTVLTALAGPFQTYEILNFPARLAYWAFVVGLSVGVDAGFRWLMRGQSLVRRLSARLWFAAVLGGLVHVVNRQVFHGWMGWEALVWLTGVVWAVAMSVEGLAALSRHAHQSAQPTPHSRTPTADAAFQQRLPHDRRGGLIRLEAQDHYLKVVTDKGEALILMRLGDAEAELAAFDGLRVHRSHWVARDRVRDVVRRAGRMFLILDDRSEVPVSRTYKDAVRAAGLGG